MAFIIKLSRSSLNFKIKIDEMKILKIILFFEVVLNKFIRTVNKDNMRIILNMFI